jgi:hypothetical protein
VAFWEGADTLTANFDVASRANDHMGISNSVSTMLLKAGGFLFNSNCDVLEPYPVAPICGFLDQINLQTFADEKSHSLFVLTSEPLISAAVSSKPCPFRFKGLDSQSPGCGRYA